MKQEATNINTSKTYHINTYGCQMNVHESEKISGILENNGYTVADCIENADVIVYNSCCVRETAETKIYGHLGKAKKLKEVNPRLRVILCGCMAQKPGETDKLKKRLPFVDLVIGTHNIHKLGDYLEFLEEHGSHFEVWDSECDINDEYNMPPIKRKDKFSAYITIMQGCNNFCSYCIVPYVRGRERSRDFDTIVREAELLVADGVKEITLLGQNVNSYGKDLAKRHEQEQSVATNYNNSGNFRDSKECEGRSFAELLRTLNNISGKFKIKFMTSHPKDLSEDVILAIAEGKNLAKFIHLPVQAGSDRILKLMNRTYTRTQYLDLVKLIKMHIPNVGISSDLMVGFPTETNDEFSDSLTLVESAKFNNLYTFIYNRRSGTKADLMDGQIPEDVKTERIERVIKRQFEISTEDAKKCIGQTYEILCEKFEQGKGCGKSWDERTVYFSSNIEKNYRYYDTVSDIDKPVFCDNAGDISSTELEGRFILVKITSAKNTKIYGELLGISRR